jgi:hypothetical protein
MHGVGDKDMWLNSDKHLNAFADWLNSDPTFDDGNPFDLMRAELRAKPHSMAADLADHALANAERHYNNGNMRSALLTVWNVARVLHAQTSIIARDTVTQVYVDAPKIMRTKVMKKRTGYKTRARDAWDRALTKGTRFRTWESVDQVDHLLTHYPDEVREMKRETLSSYVREFRRAPSKVK